MNMPPKTSQEKQVSQTGGSGDVLALSKRNTRIQLESLGATELKYVSLNDSREFDKLLRQELSDKDFVTHVLHHQLVKPEINFADFQKLSDKDLEDLSRAFIKKEDYTFKYFRETGDFFKDFKIALATGRKKYAEELAKTLQPIIKSAQESLSTFSRNYASIIQQTLTGTSYVQESLQQLNGIASQISDTQRRIVESMKPVIEQYQSMAKIIVESLRPQIDIWQRWVEQNKAIFDNFSGYWIEFQQRYNIAETGAVRVLQKYKWFITPSFPISFIFEVMKLDQVKGRHDKAVNNLFIEYYEADGWENLGTMVSSWKNNPLLKNRYKILMDCVAAVKMANKKGINEANVILPTLITQIDGVLTDYLNSKGLQWDSDYDDWVDIKTGRVRKVGRKTQFKNAKPKVLTTPLDDLANDIFLNILFQRSQKGKPLATPFNFNRHKIIHGENVKYGRKDYLIRAFMVLDLLAQL
jgi:hypothetical protein